MATHDVPGANPANADTLRMGCWAEHEDGSLLFVESTEGDRVVYSLFDVSVDPPLEYRDSMGTDGFNASFSWPTKGKPFTAAVEKWTWHDKTPFDWTRVMRHLKPGVRHASAEGLMSAAHRVATALGLRAERTRARGGKASTRVLGIIRDLQDAIGELDA